MNKSGVSYGPAASGLGGALVSFYSSVMPSDHSNDTEARCGYESEMDEFNNAFRFYMNGVLLNLVGAFGVVGNVISMVILSRPQMRSSINYLLIGLARCDTVLIVTSILLFGLTGIYPYTKRLHYYYFYIYPNITPYVFTLTCMAQTVSVYLTLTVTVERFVAVCHPLRARSLCTYGRARFYVLAIVAVSFLYNLPKFWETDVVTATHLIGGIEVPFYCVRASSFRSKLYVTIYIHWMYLIFMCFLPFLSLAILNSCIYKQIRKANAERQRLSNIQRREIDLATMLLVVVLVFFVCHLLALVSNTIESFTVESPATLAILNPMAKTSNLLVTINSSVNFIIYVIFGEKFKRLFLKIFCSQGRLSAVSGGGRDSPDLPMQDDSLVSNGDRFCGIRLQRHHFNDNKHGGRVMLSPVLDYQRRPLQRPLSYSTTITSVPNDSVSTQV